MKVTATKTSSRSSADVSYPVSDYLLHQTSILIALLLLFFGGRALAGVRYVDANSANPAPPYKDWGTAARNIQDAVDAAAEGDEIVVTNGIYQTGGRAAYGTMTNRVAIGKQVVVRSVNGPGVTLIEGSAAPGLTNGDGAIRCVYVGTNAVLGGFTLTNGHTRMDGDLMKEQSGGGVWCENSGVVTNCTLSGNSASQYGGGALGGTLNNCTLIANSASESGGADGCTLNNCTLKSNSAEYGGGASFCDLYNCTVIGNSAQVGGGANHCHLNNCTLSGNSAESGGGTYGCTLDNCELSGNTAGYGGGGGGKHIEQLHGERQLSHLPGWRGVFWRGEQLHRVL